MAAAKKHWTTIKVPSDFLKTLPEAPPIKLKLTMKKPVEASKSTIAKDDATKDEATAKDEAPTTPSKSSGSGLEAKALSSSGNSLKQNGKVKHWAKRPAQFKTFSGFKVTYDKWLPEASNQREEKKPETVKQVKAEV